MGKLISVWGPTGAPGRSIIAFNLAAEMAELGSRVLLVDADVYGGALGSLAGITDEVAGFAAVCRLTDSNDDVLEDVIRYAHSITGFEDRLHLLTGITRPSRWPELSAMRVTAFVDAVRDGFDAVVVDVGFNLERDEEISSDLFAPRRNAATLTLLENADVVMAVSNSDALGLSRFIRAYDDLSEVCPDAMRQVVVNRVRKRIDMSGSSHPRAILERFAGLRDIVELPEDLSAVNTSVLLGKPLVQAAAQSKIRRAFTTLARSLVNVPEVISPRGRFALRRS